MFGILYINSDDSTIISNTIFTIFIKFDIDNYDNIYVKIYNIHIFIYKCFKIMSL